MPFGDRFDIRAALDDEVRDEYIARAAERERAEAERERAAAGCDRTPYPTDRTVPVASGASTSGGSCAAPGGRPGSAAPASPNTRGAQAASNPARRSKPAARGQVAGGLWSAGYAADDGEVDAGPTAGEYVELPSEAVWDDGRPRPAAGARGPAAAHPNPVAALLAGVDRLHEALRALAQSNARVLAALGVLALTAVVLLVVLAVRSCSAPAAVVSPDDAAATDAAQTAGPALIPLSSRNTAALGLGADGKLVVALDPGHGAEDPGVVLDSTYEANINWQIAQYCAAYLRQYEGVEVVLTRAEAQNPSFESRALAAVNANADILVSLHINWNDDPVEQGAYTYYPNATSTWKQAETVVPGQTVAGTVLQRLVGLGLKDNGSWEYTLSIYDDPSVASYLYQDDETGVTDYFAIIRWPRAYGIPSVLVEHAFLSNPSDGPLLQVDSFLKALGEADAKGILEAYGFPVQ